jgi:ATP-binding cassette subfamily F protein 3
MAMQVFEGAVILVSHDRHLLRNTVDEFLLVANGEVTDFKGDLSDYQQWLTEQRRNLSPTKMISRESKSLSADQKREQKRLAADKRSQLRPLKNKIDQLERNIDKLQMQLGKFEQILADSDLYSAENKQKLKQILAEQATANSNLETIELEWMERQEELEALE